MSDEKGLLDDICANPDDDAPRLVYADWLEENGRPERAEFIRVQLALAGPEADGHRRGELRRREQELRQAHGDEWLQPLRELLGPKSTPRFERGFPAQLALGVRQFTDHAEELFRLAPAQDVKLLRLKQSNLKPAELAASPHLGRLRTLDLNGSQIEDDDLAALLFSPHLGNLRALRIGGNEVGQLTARALVRPGGLTGLKELSLENTLLSSGMFGSLLELLVPEPPFRLEALDLTHTSLDREAVTHLTRWPGLASLRALRLRGSAVGVWGTQALTASPHLGPLEELDLSGCSVGVNGYVALGRAGKLSSLRVLRLASNPGGLSGLPHLLSGGALANLRELDLQGSGIGNNGAAALAEWPGLASVRDLHLDNNGLTDVGIEALVTSPHLGELRVLSLVGSTVGDRGAKLLAGCPKLAGLEVLDVAYTSIGKAGGQALLESPHLPRSLVLRIQGPGMPRDVKEDLLDRFEDALI
jgi:uncharacterized protein (TIGR02996 family)